MNKKEIEEKKKEEINWKQKKYELHVSMVLQPNPPLTLSVFHSLYLIN